MYAYHILSFSEQDLAAEVATKMQSQSLMLSKHVCCAKNNNRKVLEFEFTFYNRMLNMNSNKFHQDQI